MNLKITIVQVPDGKAQWKVVYTTLLPPAKAVQQWHERREMACVRAILRPKTELVETPLVRAWTTTINPLPKQTPWYRRLLRWSWRASADAAYLFLNGPTRSPNGPPDRHRFR